MSNMVGIENLILKRNTKGQQMRVITLVLVIVAVFFFAKDAHGRTIMLDEEQVETVEGKYQYIGDLWKKKTMTKKYYLN